MADGRKAVLSFQSIDDQTLVQYLPDLAAQAKAFFAADDDS